MAETPPDHIEVRGARVHNLKNIDVDIPLGKITGIAGVSGSGKSSLALGVLYAEGSRRYLEALSTYTRRRLTQAAKADVDEVLYIPAALALHQRPAVPGIRSTFGTGTELLNSLRLMFSRLASHRCPHGHYVPPSLAVAAGKPLVCPECGESFYAPSAEELSFNSQGACPKCGGTGIVHTVDLATLVPDESLTIDEGAVAPWNSLMWSLMTDVCRAMGVRTDVPFRDLTDKEKDIVYNGPMVKKHIFYRPKNGSNSAGELDFTYYSAVKTVENALAKVKDDKGMKRVEKFLKFDACPDCGGSRLSEAARAPKLRGITLDAACRMTLTELIPWVKGVPASLPEEMRPMAESICASFLAVAARLVDLGLSYLSLDRAGNTLSTGERQRMQIARAVRNRTTGVLYVLDEPSIGLHPSNIVGLTDVIHDLIHDGNSVVLVDHDVQILKESDWVIEMGPVAGAKGGNVIAKGTVHEIAGNKNSRIGPFLAGTYERRVRPVIPKPEIFSEGERSGFRRTPAEWAFDFLWDLPEVGVVLSGMSTPEQVAENVSYAERSAPGMLSEAEHQILKKAYRQFLNYNAVPCTGCAYCMHCPKGIAIPQSIAAYNEAFKENNYQKAKKQYEEWVPLFGAKPSECISCRQCEAICPQQLEVSKWMHEIDSFFTKEGGRA